MTYEEVVQSTYIEPIRSVVAVDDQFPTLDWFYDSLLKGLGSGGPKGAGGAAEPAAGEAALQVGTAQPNAETTEKQAAEGEAPTGGEGVQALPPATVADTQEVKIAISAKETVRAGDILAYCRKAEWLIDIHDGSKVMHGNGEDGDIIRHLHQTDLLILDYQLQGEALGGEISVRILRGLARNPHFNLVVVYTQKPVHEAFREISLGLLRPSALAQDQDLASKIGDAWDDWTGADATAIAGFQDLVDIAGYLSWRSAGSVHEESAYRKAFVLYPALEAYATPRVAALVADRTFTVLDLLRWLIGRYEQSKAESFDANGLDKLGAKAPAGDGANWLNSENLFITVIPKKIEGAHIIGELKKALIDWRPAPHQIILSQMRAELEASGGAIEQKALEDGAVQAGLLWQMLEPDAQARRAIISSILDRQWAEVWLVMRDKVVKSAGALLDIVFDPAVARHRTTSLHYPGSFADQAPPANQDVWIRLNSYWSTQPVNGHHLMTGHIFQIGETYWVCLAPSCDLVPDRGKGERWRGRIGGELIFKAVQLIAIPPDKAIKHATKGLCVYLRLGSDVKSFSFLDPTKGDDANPDWEDMIAVSDGVFAAGNIISLRRVSRAADVPVLAEPIQAPVVGQLRYEYALNLLQRLSQNLSRIGLDFIKPR